MSHSTLAPPPPPPPEVVGIPILPELPLLRVINKSLASLDRARKASRNREACPILQLRSLHTFCLPPSTTSPRASSSPPPSLHPHQTAINDAYRHAFRLPPWAHTAFLHLPLQQGGPGAPLLAYRAPLNLLRTYLRASGGPNTLAVAATASLFSPRRPTPWLTEEPAPGTRARPPRRHRPPPSLRPRAPRTAAPHRLTSPPPFPPLRRGRMRRKPRGHPPRRRLPPLAPPTTARSSAAG